MQLIRNLIKVSWASFQHHKSSKTSKSYKEPTHFKNKGDCLGIYFWHSPWCSTNGSVMNRTLCKGQEQFSKNTPDTVNKTLLLSVRLLQSSFEYIQSEEYNGFFFHYTFILCNQSIQMLSFIWECQLVVEYLTISQSYPSPINFLRQLLVIKLIK